MAYHLFANHDEWRFFGFSISDAAHDSDYVEDTKCFQREIVKYKLTVICVREDTDEMVGANFLMVERKDDTFTDFIVPKVFCGTKDVNVY